MPSFAPSARTRSPRPAPTRLRSRPRRTEELLRELKAIELIYEKALFPELAYMFKHALTHDVAYNSLLVQRRKELHRLIGLAIEELCAERLAEQYEVLAHHFSRAEDWPKALDYLLRSAEKAAKASANREAVGFYGQALEVASGLGAAVSPATVMGIHKVKADLYMILSDFQQSRAEAERLLELARRAGDEGLALAQKLGDEAIHHRLLNCLGWLHMELGDLEGAEDFNRQSAGVGRRRKDPGTIPNAEINLGDIFLAKGDLALAQEFYEGVERFAGDAGTSEWMRFRYSIRLAASLGELWLARGDLERAQRHAERCLELAARTNSRKNLVRGWRLQGEIALTRRQWGEAGQALRRALGIAQTIGSPPQLWTTYVALGRLHAEGGRPEEAREAYQAARTVIEGVRGLQHATLRASLDAAPLIRQVYQLSGDQG